MDSSQKPVRVVVVGGGTGCATVLSGLKREPRFALSAIVPVSDQGGSSKEFVNAFIRTYDTVNLGGGRVKIVPPGDIGNAMIALSSHPEELTELLNYRFHKLQTRFTGHSVRNLIVNAAVEIWGINGLAKLGELLRLSGTVIPVADRFTRLSATLEDGSPLTSLTVPANGGETLLEGEEAIDYLPYHAASSKKIMRVSLASLGGAAPRICKAARDAIARADLIVFAPSDLWTSVIPILLVPGVAGAMKKSRARRVYFSPLMTKRLHSDGFTAFDFIRKIEEHSFPGIVQTLVFNTTKIPPAILAHYAKEAAERVALGKPRPGSRVKVVRAPLLDPRAKLPRAADRIIRSIVRHDPQKILNAVRQLI